MSRRKSDPASMAPTRVLGIDPGPTCSGVVDITLPAPAAVKGDVLGNERVLDWVSWCDVVVIEKIMPYRNVTAEAIEAAVWTGKFIREAELLDPAPRVVLLSRGQAIQTLLGRMPKRDERNGQSVDALLWARVCALWCEWNPQAKDDRWLTGTEYMPGPLFSVKSHARAALAVVLAAFQRGLLQVT